MSRFPPRAAPRGLTMIEMLVSIALGLVVVGAATYTYIGSKGAYSGNESLARIQEAGRFALDSIMRDIRRTGALGCGSLKSPTSGSPIVPNVLAPLNATLGLFPMQGFPVPSTAQPPLATLPVGWIRPTGSAGYWGGDVLQLQIASGAPARMSVNPDLANGTITIADNGRAGFNANDYALLADCNSATAFQVAAVAAATPPAAVLTYTTSSPPPALTTGTSGFSVTTFPSVQHFDQVTYYIGTTPNGASALYRYSMSGGAAEELVENIEDMDIVYGVDTVPPSYTATVFEHADAVTAAGAWGSVISVRVSVIAVGDQLGAAASPQVLLFRGTDPNPIPSAATARTAPDTRLRQIFTATATLRDRVQ